MALVSEKDLVNAILGVEKYRDPSRWIVSHDGVRVGPVQAVDCGRDGAGVWFRFGFTEGGADRTIRGTYTLTNRAERVELDGRDLGPSDVTVGEKVAGGLVAVVQLKSGEHLQDVYRFDGTILSALEVLRIVLGGHVPGV